jgi:hypothetical protein
MEQKFHHTEVCIAFERGGVYFVSGKGADAKAFNTCKGIVIISGVAEEGVSFGLYNMHSSGWF